MVYCSSECVEGKTYCCFSCGMRGRCLEGHPDDVCSGLFTLENYLTCTDIDWNKSEKPIKNLSSYEKLCKAVKNIGE